MPTINVAAIIQQARTRNRQLLTEIEAKAALSAEGIPVSETHLARSRDEALTHAQALGFPVVLKICSPDIVHKSDVGGVALTRQLDEPSRRGAWCGVRRSRWPPC